MSSSLFSDNLLPESAFEISAFNRCRNVSYGQIKTDANHRSSLLIYKSLVFKLVCPLV